MQLPEAELGNTVLAMWNVASPLKGRQAELTYLEDHSDSFASDGQSGSIEPIGNAQPTEAGYTVITSQIEAA